jgi:hypothetical protein
MKKLKPMRVLVTGGRTKTLQRLGIDAGAVHVQVVRTLNAISACGDREVTIIHGGATGVDAMADAWADRTHTIKEVYPISKEEWDSLGKAAGPTRNAFMLTKKPDVVVAFVGGNGTIDMVARARDAGVRVFEVPRPAIVEVPATC